MHTQGLCHVALWVEELEACVAFYCERLDMKVVWQPDADNYYLSSGKDNLALHRSTKAFDKTAAQHLDHIGFLLSSHAEVEQCQQEFIDAGVKIAKAAKQHRDGSSSFYCYDPDGNVVQMIYIPELV